MPAFTPPTWVKDQGKKAARERIPVYGRKPPSTIYSPWSQAQILQFYGTLTNTSQVAFFQFSVLAGDGAPTITAGYVKVNVIDRPQRKGFTVPVGYDPITMDVPVQFESLVAQPVGAFGLWSDVEYDIQQLEWMAGRGKLYAAAESHGVGSPASGDPPLVRVKSIDSSGNETALIPPSVHGIDWYVSNVAYDTHPYRDRDGNRMRQAATITLTEFVFAGGQGFDSPTTRAKARNTAAASYITRYSTPAINTIGKATEFYTGNTSVQAKQAVLAANPKLKLKSWNQPLAPGTKILIPTLLALPSS